MVTTITLAAPTKERFERYRHGGLGNDSQVMESLTDIVPDYSELQEGCTECGHTPDPDLPVNQVGGAVVWFDHGDITTSSWFCSFDCISKVAEDDHDTFVESNPDLVIVGGCEMPRTRIASGTRYRSDDDVRYVTIDVPGAFEGDGVGIEYDYTGEPVYFKNRGRWVGSAVVDDVVHEEGATTLVLGDDPTIERDNHPSDRLREEYGSGDDEGDEADD